MRSESLKFIWGIPWGDHEILGYYSPELSNFGIKHRLRMNLDISLIILLFYNMLYSILFMNIYTQV